MLEALCGAHHSACETVRLQTKQATNLQSLIIIPAWFVLIWEVVKGGYMLIVCRVKRPTLMWFIISVAPRVSSWFGRGFPVVCGSVCLVNTEEDGLDHVDRRGCRQILLLFTFLIYDSGMFFFSPKMLLLEKRSFFFLLFLLDFFWQLWIALTTLQPCVAKYCLPSGGEKGQLSSQTSVLSIK